MRGKVYGFFMAVLVLLLAILIGLAVQRVITVVMEGITDVMTAVIAGAASLVAAILTHVLTTYSEHDRQIRQEKRENYAKVIEKVAEYLRDRDNQQDEFDTALLRAWIYGSPKVNKRIKEFREAKTKTHGQLERILLAIREDIGIEWKELEGELPAQVLEETEVKLTGLARGRG